MFYFNMLLTLEQAVRVRALARDTVLCSWTRHFTLTVPLSTQMYYRLLANLMLGQPYDGQASHPGGGGGGGGSRNTPSRFVLLKLG